jgi:proteic killer suppression protein
MQMIETWANSATRQFAETGKCKFSGVDEEAAQDLLASLDAATSLKDLSPLKSVGLHKLDQDRKGQWVLTINGPWRICFRFEDGNAHDVEIVNYHKG